MVPRHLLANASSSSLAAGLMHSYIAPVMGTLSVIATLVCVVLVIIGGYQYIASTGRPENLENAKRIIRNALLGLVVVLAASALTAILTHAYGGPGGGVGQNMPSLAAIKTQQPANSLAGVLISAITGLLQNIIESVAVPFLKALSYFTSGTPLMATSGSVFKLWLSVVGISDALFVVIVALLGFRIMSATTLGLAEIEFKHLLPQLGLIFLLSNSSIFLIDAVISISNVMIHALDLAFFTTSVWSTLSSVSQQSSGLGIAELLILIVFLILAVALLVYYVGRLVVLYIGAVLSPLLCLLWLVPVFRDFVVSAAKVYLSTIFVLFIHVVILQLAASILVGLTLGSPTHQPDPIMASIVGLATVAALLKTQGVLMQLSYASMGARTASKLGSQFINGISQLNTAGSRSFPAYATARNNPVVVNETTTKIRSASNSTLINSSSKLPHVTTKHKANPRPQTAVATAGE